MKIIIIHNTISKKRKEKYDYLEVLLLTIKKMIISFNLILQIGHKP